jgi:hypothetical protein
MTALCVAKACAEIVPIGAAAVTTTAAREPIHLAARLCVVAFIVRLR